MNGRIQCCNPNIWTYIWKITQELAASHNCRHTQNCPNWISCKLKRNLWQNSCRCYARATWLKLISSLWYAALLWHWALNINASAILLQNENWKWIWNENLSVTILSFRHNLWRKTIVPLALCYMWLCTQSCPILACSKPTVGNCLVFMNVGFRGVFRGPYPLYFKFLTPYSRVLRIWRICMLYLKFACCSLNQMDFSSI